MTDLDALSRTALTPFWARVQDARMSAPILGDRAALALAPEVGRRCGVINVDAATRVGCCLRNRVVDDWLARLTASAGGDTGTVVDVGVGLNTRLLRQPGRASRYVEVDSSAIIGVRDQLMPDTGAIRVRTDGMCVADWIDAVDLRRGSPVVLVLEGVLTYQAPSRVTRFFSDAASSLPGAYVLFDSLSPLAAWPANRREALAEGRPRYSWSPWRTRRIRAGTRRLRVMEEKGFLDLPPELTHGFGIRTRALHGLPPMRRAYRLTMARLPQ